MCNFNYWDNHRRQMTPPVRLHICRSLPLCKFELCGQCPSGFRRKKHGLYWMRPSLRSIFPAGPFSYFVEGKTLQYICSVVNILWLTYSFWPVDDDLQEEMNDQFMTSLMNIFVIRAASMFSASFSDMIGGRERLANNEKYDRPLEQGQV